MNVMVRVVITQAVLGASATLVFVFVAPEQARAAAFALASVVLPSALYAWYVQRTLHATRLLWQGVWRMLLTAVLMAVSIIVYKVEPLGFFCHPGAGSTGLPGTECDGLAWHLQGSKR